jgi:hypothetical protein
MFTPIDYTHEIPVYQPFASESSILKHFNRSDDFNIRNLSWNNTTGHKKTVKDGHFEVVQYLSNMLFDISSKLDRNA